MSSTKHDLYTQLVAYTMKTIGYDTLSHLRYTGPPHPDLALLHHVTKLPIVVEVKPPVVSQAGTAELFKGIGQCLWCAVTYRATPYLALDQDQYLKYMSMFALVPSIGLIAYSHKHGDTYIWHPSINSTSRQEEYVTIPDMYLRDISEYLEVI